MNEQKESRPCAACKGSKTTDRHWDGKGFGLGPCKECNASGIQFAPDVAAILELITKKTKTGRAFRQSKPKLNECHDKLHAQAYYVWRLVRFHGGVDVTMPMVASLFMNSRHYAWMDHLDLIVDALAKRTFGTNLAAAYRWSNALGGSLTVPAGMPATAYSGGPAVMDQNKPAQELLELK